MTDKQSSFNMKPFVIVLLLCAPFFIFLGLGFGKDPSAIPDMLTGKPAPQFELLDLQGNTVSLKQFKGKPVVLNFWSTWCGPCKYEHPVLINAARQLTGKVHFLGVVYQDKKENVQEYLVKQGSAYPNGLDQHSEVAIAYGVSGVPESFIIDKNGVIVHKVIGLVRPETFTEYVLPLIN